ncbi:hypothetical protein ABK040_009634 [Willaertia magna]
MSIPKRANHLFLTTTTTTPLNHHSNNNKKEIIKILSYNINWGACNFNGQPFKNSQRVLEAILQSDADIVCLQETHDGWTYFMSQSNLIKELYPYQQWEHKSTEVYFGSGLAVLSKIPIETKLLESNVEGSFFPAMLITVPSLNGNNNIYNNNNNILQQQQLNNNNNLTLTSDMEEITTNNIVNNTNQKENQTTTTTALQILNVHLRPPLAFDQTESNVACYLYKTITVRKLEIDSFLKQIESNNQQQEQQKQQELEQPPLIIVGDFNENSSGALFQTTYSSLLKEKQFKDAIRNETTCKVFTDYKEEASDHLPCIAHLRKL